MSHYKHLEFAVIDYGPAYHEFVVKNRNEDFHNLLDKTVLFTENLEIGLRSKGKKYKIYQIDVHYGGKRNELMSIFAKETK